MSTLDAPTPAELPSQERLARDLFHAHKSRSLMRLRRWRFGSVDTAMIAATRAAETPAQVHAYATVAVAYAVFNGSRAIPSRGAASTGLGRAMRQIGRTGGYGPRDPAAVRAMDRIVSAGDFADLHEAVVAAITRMDASKASSPPNWARLASDLTDWQTSPSTRDRVRLAWVRDFHTHAPAVTETGADAGNGDHLST